MHDINKYFNFQNLYIRGALIDDIPVLASLINQAYQYLEEIRGKKRTNDHDLEEKMRENDYFVVLDKEKIVGCFYIKEQNSSVHFGMFALLPNYRGTGLGKEIIKSIERFALSKNIKNIEIGRMSASPWLKKYYEDQGFVETGEIINWNKIDIICMQKFL